MKKRVLVLCLCAAAILPVFGQDGLLDVRVFPAFDTPFENDREFFTMGGGGGVSAHFRLPFLPILSLGAEVGYHLAPLNATDAEGRAIDTLSLVSGAAVLGFDIGFFDRFAAHIGLKGGYFYSFLNKTPDSGDANPYVGSSVGLSYRLLPWMSLGADFCWHYYLGLYQFFSFPVQLTLHLGKAGERPVKERAPAPRPATLTAEKAEPEEAAEQIVEAAGQEEEGQGLDITNVEFDSIFTVFFKYYDANPIGVVTLKNFEPVPVSNVKVSFYVRQYMDNPKEAAIIDEMASGEEREIDIHGLFTSDVLEITEDTKVSALINLDYVKEGAEQSKEVIETIRLHNRNAVTWDDDRKACAFVTAKDPAVLKFAKNVAGWIKDEQIRAVDDNLEIAAALHEALDLYGITYIPDPTTPYVEFSQNELAIDYLQFPKQTLEFLAGDCDDLSILYSALLEAAGIETAFVTTPGHIFVAFNLDMDPREAEESFLYPDDLIYHDGKAWIPVEITDRGRGFVEAWETGAKEWREAFEDGSSGIYPMHAAWEVYEPVGFPGTVNVVLPEREEIASTFRAEIEAFIQREMAPQLAEVQRQIQSSQGDVRYENRLGVLYAQYGLDENAMQQFEKVLSKKEYMPALLNLGSLYFLNDDLKRAREYYERAYEMAPDNANVLLSYARVNYELENYGSVREAYTKLKQKSPDLAEKYAYLEERGEEAARASHTAKEKGMVEWEVEQ